MRRLVMLGSLLLSGVASAQDSLAIAGADRETIAQLTQIVATTSERGLPTEPVINEARFGALMRVSGPRMVNAARDMATFLEQARAALAPQPSPADITAGADALKNKIPVESLRRIREARKGRPVAVHLGLLIQLVVTNVSIGRAEKTVLELIKRSASNELLADLGNAVNADVARGGRPDDVLELQFKTLTARLGGSPSGVAADLTQGAAAPPKKP